MNKQIQEFVAKRQALRQSGNLRLRENEEILIPVAVHVVGNAAIQGMITDAVIETQINALNTYFRTIDPGVVAPAHPFAGVAKKTTFKFCLYTSATTKKILRRIPPTSPVDYTNYLYKLRDPLLLQHAPTNGNSIPQSEHTIG